MDVEQALPLVDLSQAFISTLTFSQNCGKHSEFIDWRILLSFSFEISMKNSDSLFDLLAGASLPIPWGKGMTEGFILETRLLLS